MNRTLTLSISTVLVLGLIGACASIQNESVNNYYRAKTLFLVVAEEAYEYASLPSTPETERKAIKSIGLRCFELIDDVDTGKIPMLSAMNALLGATADLQRVVRKEEVFP